VLTIYPLKNEMSRAFITIKYKKVFIYQILQYNLGLGKIATETDKVNDVNDKMIIRDTCVPRDKGVAQTVPASIPIKLNPFAVLRAPEK
jgi:hypothetical protein